MRADSSRREDRRPEVTVDTNGSQPRLSRSRERIQLLESINSAMHSLALRARGVHGFVRLLLIKARS